MKPSKESTLAPNNPPVVIQFALLLFLVIILASLGGGLVQLLGKMMGMDYATLAANVKVDAPLEEKNFIRLGLSIGHLWSFTIPSLLFMWLLHQKEWLQRLAINTFPTFLASFLGSIFILSLFPLAQWAYWLNQQLPMPNWAIQQEQLINQTIISLLKIEQPYELSLIHI